LALNVRALPEHLEKIEKAETYVRNVLKLGPTRNMRVRLLSQNRSTVEVDEDVLELAHLQILQEDSQIKDYFVDELGFASVNVRSFKTGSVAQQQKHSSINEQATTTATTTTTTITHEDVVA
jgi:PP-loop superfamily ATP-utilizing enzyme